MAGRKSTQALENHARLQASPLSEELPPGYKMTELGLLPEEWQVVRLGEVAEKPQYGFTAAAKRDRVGPKMLRITDIQDGYVNWDSVPYCECPEEVVGNYLLQFGDILFARTGSVGKTFLVSYLPDCPVIFASYLIRVRIDKARLDPAFAFLFMQSAPYWAQIRSITHGAVQPNINATQIKSLILPLPPLPEQQAIAHVLRTVQRAKEATERVIAALRELKKSLMIYLFTYGPVPVDQTDQVLLKETEIGPIPAHWQVVRLGEVVEKPQYGYTTSATNKPVGPKFLRITDIQSGRVLWEAVPYCTVNPSDMERFLLKPGDILIARIGATTGKAFFVTDCPCAVFGSYLIRVRVISDKIILPEFLWCYMTTPRYWGQINASKGGRLKQGINILALQNLLLPLPPLPEQRAIAEVLQSVDRKIEAEEARQRALEALFRTLLHDLMTARLRLPPAFIARFAEDAP